MIRRTALILGVALLAAVWLDAGAAAACTVTVHLHSGDFQAGGTAPSPAAPSRSADAQES